MHALRTRGIYVQLPVLGGVVCLQPHRGVLPNGHRRSTLCRWTPRGGALWYQRQTPDLPHQGPQHCALQRRHHKKGDEIIFQAPTHYLKGAGQCSEYKQQNSLLVLDLRRATSFLCKISSKQKFYTTLPSSVTRWYSSTVFRHFRLFCTKNGAELAQDKTS